MDSKEKNNNNILLGSISILVGYLQILKSTFLLVVVMSIFSSLPKGGLFHGIVKSIFSSLPKEYFLSGCKYSYRGSGRRFGLSEFAALLN